MRARPLFSTFVVATLALASLMLASGCNHNDDADESGSYDNIGETRVFDAGGQTACASGCSGECVPAPAPIAEVPHTVKPNTCAIKAKKAERSQDLARNSRLNIAAAPRHKFQLIGEMDMDE